MTSQSKGPSSIPPSPSPSIEEVDNLPSTSLQGDLSGELEDVPLDSAKPPPQDSAEPTKLLTNSAQVEESGGANGTNNLSANGAQQFPETQEVTT